MDKPTTNPAAPGSKAEEAQPPEPLVRDSHTTGPHSSSARGRQFEIVLDQVADGITVYDTEGNLVYANEAAVRLFGYPSLEALLRPEPQDIRRSFEIMDESGKPFPVDQLPNLRVLRGEQENEAVVRYRVMATGEERWFIVTARRVFDTVEQRPFIVSIVRDITERKRSEAALRFLAEAGMVLAPSLDYAATLQDLARLIVPFLADACIIDVREGGWVRRMATVHVDPTQQALMDELRAYPPDRITVHPVAHALLNGQSELGPELPDSLLVSIAQDAHHLEVLRELHPRSYMVVPMQARGRILGAITFWIIDSQRRYSQSDVNLAEDLTRRAAIAVDNARLFQGEQLARAAADKVRFQTTQLQAVTAGLAEALTSREVAEVMTNEGTKVLDAEAGWVALISAQGTTLEIITAADFSGRELEFADRIPIEAPFPLAEAARLGKPVLLRSPEDFRRYPEIDSWLHGDHDRVFAAIPLVAEKRILGVLGLRFPASRDFTGDEIGLMNTLAQECAQALERARLYGAERAARMASEVNGQRLAFLAEASRILATSLNYEQTLTRLAEIAVPQLADWCTVDIIEEDGSVGHLAVAHVDEEKARWARELYERYPYDPNRTEGLPRVLRTGEPELYPDIPEAMVEASTNDPELLEILRAVGFTSVMIVPLLARGRTLGAITFVSAESQRHYGPADLEFVQDLASRAAIALDNARLYRDAQRAIKAREEFISIASHELKTPFDHHQDLFAAPFGASPEAGC